MAKRISKKVTKRINKPKTKPYNLVGVGDLFDFITEELNLANISKKEINSKKHQKLRENLVYRAFTRYLETEPKESKADVIKYVRSETGLRFSNATGRKDYDLLRDIDAKYGYAPRLRAGTLPSDDKIPLIEYRLKGVYLLGFKIYLYKNEVNNSKKGTKEYTNKIQYNKGKRLPKSAERTANGNYNSTSDYVYFSGVKLNKRDAIDIMYIMLSGKMEDLGSLREQIEGSDYKGVLADNSYKVIGFQYVRLART